MYSLDASIREERKERIRQNASEVLSLAVLWLLPWAVSVFTLVLGLDMLDAKGFAFGSLILFFSLVLYRTSSKEDASLRSLYVSFSYLVTLSVLLTVVLK